LQLLAVVPVAVMLLPLISNTLGMLVFVIPSDIITSPSSLNLLPPMFKQVITSDIPDASCAVRPLLHLEG